MRMFSRMDIAHKAKSDPVTRALERLNLSTNRPPDAAGWQAFVGLLHDDVELSHGQRFENLFIASPVPTVVEELKHWPMVRNLSHTQANLRATYVTISVNIVEMEQLCVMNSIQ